MKRNADAGNWQARGQEFAVGQSVRLMIGDVQDEGRVIAVWAGIGMVDVQFPHTSVRLPVEDLQIVNPGEDPLITPVHEDVPGGPGSAAWVSQGAPQSNVIEKEDPRVEIVETVEDLSQEDMVARVAHAFVKKSLYWHAQNRKYRSTRSEHDAGRFCCPTKMCGTTLRRGTYMMEDGQKIRLYACPKCLFMIRAEDILMDHCLPPTVFASQHNKYPAVRREIEKDWDRKAITVSEKNELLKAISEADTEREAMEIVRTHRRTR